MYKTGLVAALALGAQGIKCVEGFLRALIVLNGRNSCGTLFMATTEAEIHVLLRTHFLLDNKD